MDSYEPLARGAARVASGTKSSMEISQEKSKSKFNQLTAANIERYKQSKRKLGNKSALSVSTGAGELSTAAPLKTTTFGTESQRQKRLEAVQIKVHDPHGVTAVNFASARGSGGDPGAATEQLLADAAMNDQT